MKGRKEGEERMLLKIVVSLYNIGSIDFHRLCKVPFI